MASKKLLANKDKESITVIEAPFVELEYFRLRAIGLTPLLCNNGSHIYQIPPEVQKKDKTDKKRKNTDPTLEGSLGIKEKRNPEAEYHAARYQIDNKTDGFPAYLIKKSAQAVAHTILRDISKTVIQRSIWIVAEYDGWLLRIDTDVFPPPIDERLERIPSKNSNKGAPTYRYRPRYDNWSMPFTVEYLKGMITPQNLVNLLTIAGISAGIGEHRPERGGEWGRYKVIGEDQYQASLKKSRRKK